MDLAKKLAIAAGVSLAAFALVAFVQRKVVAIPIVGDFLPK